MNQKRIITFSLAIIILAILSYLFLYIPYRDRAARADVKRTECTQLGMQKAKTENSEADKSNDILSPYSFRYFDEQRYFYNERIDACLYRSLEVDNGLKMRQEHFNVVDLFSGQTLAGYDSYSGEGITRSSEEVMGEVNVNEIARRIFSGEELRKVEKEVYKW